MVTYANQGEWPFEGITWISRHYRPDLSGEGEWKEITDCLPQIAFHGRGTKLAYSPVCLIVKPPQSNAFKIFTGERHPGSRACPSAAHTMDQLYRAFQQVTGWRLCDNSARSARRTSESATRRQADGSYFVIDSPCDSTAVPFRHRTTREAAQQLANQIGGLMSHMNDVQAALWQREAELATAVPVVSQVDPHEWQLAGRLEATLKGGAEALGCVAAGLYILDDATSHLKLRCQWGLPADRFLAPPRELAHCMADLEALAGNAVVIEDTKQLSHWNPPESFPAAVCVPVASPNVLLGTLWMFAPETRDFSAKETNLIEIVAGRIASDLEREILLRENECARRHSRDLIDVAAWQERQLPRHSPSIDGWDIAAVPASGDTLSRDWIDWFVSSQGSLSITLASAHESGVVGAVCAATIAGALRACPERLNGNPSDVVNRINDALWFTSLGDRAASMFQAGIRPDTGLMRFTVAGGIHAHVIRGKGCQAISTKTIPVGVEPSCVFETLAQPIARGETVLIVSHLPNGSREDHRGPEWDLARSTAEVLRHHMDLSASEMAQMLRDDPSELDDYTTGTNSSPTMLIIQRRGE